MKAGEYKHSELSKQKMRENHADVSGKNNPMYQKKHSIKSRIKISETRKKRLKNNEFEVWNKNKTGLQKHTEESKKKMSIALSGSNNPAWKGGNAKLNKKLRRGSSYRNFRIEVFKKDNYKCQNCGSKKQLEIHHIKSVNKYPQLSKSIPNGLTLCKKCHSDVDSRRFI